MIGTLTAADQLTAAGFESQQAKAIVAIIRDSEESAATKGDLNTLKMELEASLAKVWAGLEADLKASLAQTETRLYRALWVQAGGIVGALVGLIGTAIAVAYFLDRYLPEGTLRP